VLAFAPLSVLGGLHAFPGRNPLADLAYGAEDPRANRRQRRRARGGGVDGAALHRQAGRYKQELARAWSGFTNFAISFTIISVLAGTWTTFGTAWNNGGPIGISIGWPVICALVLAVAVSMAELTSAFPTAGGP
jgi:hypothetical protein